MTIVAGQSSQYHGLISLGKGYALPSAKKKAAQRSVDIVCVWTSNDSTGHPISTFSAHDAVHLLAAWHTWPRHGLAHYHMAVRWDVFRGYQLDLSLLPLHKFHIGRRWGRIPGQPKVGTWRLVYTPTVTKLRRGWYEVAARVFLYGKGCPRTGCSGQVRQTRFYTF